MKLELTLTEAENGYVVRIRDKTYAVEGTEEDLIKWMRAYKDSIRLEEEEEEKRKLMMEVAAGQWGASGILNTAANAQARIMAKEIDKALLDSVRLATVPYLQKWLP